MCIKHLLQFHISKFNLAQFSFLKMETCRVCFVYTFL
nr:MAG TPA: hypothetical protein [Caudoviricetes sp.]